MNIDAIQIAKHFVHTRWSLNFYDRTELENWQAKKLQIFMRNILPQAQRFHDLTIKNLSELPFMDKATMMANFHNHNTRGIKLDDVMPIALRAEKSRDFLPMYDDLTVGLSSGTSGSRGLFLVSKKERLRWAGILLARTLPQHLLPRLLFPWQPPLRIAFFLRANSNLYTTLNSGRIEFDFYDLLKGVDNALPQLANHPPDVLVGPPSVLRALSNEKINERVRICPAHIISVADVLEENDTQAIETAFGIKPHEIYQATEGFLAYTCEFGHLHLNESFVHIEPDWLDSERTRFKPIITDFSREIQLIVRYRLNDILQISAKPCSCGRAERCITSISGRSDELLWLPATNGNPTAVFPDFIRRAILFADSGVREFEVQQDGMTLLVALKIQGEESRARQAVSSQLELLWQKLKVHPPILHFTDWQSPPADAKRRRVKMLATPEGLTCTF